MKAAAATSLEASGKSEMEGPQTVDSQDSVLGLRPHFPVQILTSVQIFLNLCIAFVTLTYK